MKTARLVEMHTETHRKVAGRERDTERFQSHR